MSEVASRPETRERHSIASRRAWARGDFDTDSWREKQSLAHKAAWARGCFANRNTQEYRERQSRIKKEAWARGDMDGVFRNNRPSKLERDFAASLDTFGIAYDQEYRISDTVYFFDFHLSKWGLLIELDGEFYHHSEWAKGHRQLERDAEKNTLAGQQGYPMLRIRGASMKSHGADNIVREILNLMAVVYKDDCIVG